MRRSSVSSGWNVAAKTRPCRTRTGSPLPAGEHFDAGPDAADARRADEHGRVVGLEDRLERVDLAAEGVALDADVEEPQDGWAGFVTRPSRAGWRPRTSRRPTPPRATSRRIASSMPEPSSRCRSVVDSPPGRTSRSTASTAAAVRTSTAPPQRARVRREVALEGEDARPHHQPRVWSRFSFGIRPISRPGIASPSSAETSASTFASRKCVVARTIAFGARRRIARLEDARADEHALGAEPHHQRRVRGRRDAAGREVRHREPARARRPNGPVRRARRGPSPCLTSSSGRSSVSRRISDVTERMWRTASTTLPVPASPFVRIIAAPSAMRRSASPRSRQPQTNGTRKACLSMW